MRVRGRGEGGWGRWEEKRKGKEGVKRNGTKGKREGRYFS